MATSAFKSNSRRGTATTTSTTCPNSTNASSSKFLRRSRSVSSISRTNHHQQPPPPPTPAEQNDFSEFSNPLFWTPNAASSSLLAPSNDTGNGEESDNTSIKAFGITGAVDRNEARGRSVTRNTKSGIGRSLSRVRGRSVSRPHYGAYESEKEEFPLTARARNRSEFKDVAISGKSANLTRNASEPRARAKSSQTETRRSHVIDNSEDDSAISNWEDAISTGSLSEAEVKTTVHEQMKPVISDRWASDTAADGIYETVRSEVRHAISDIQNDLEDTIRRNNASGVTTDVNNIPPDLVDPGAIELVLDIRREYAKKFEESEERARKLKADLSVEEQRRQELARILKEILPEPKSSASQRSRVRRRRSNERKSISKCLTEEAMAYFDECVSISTFDSSDFSAPEDPPQGSSNGITNTVGDPGRSQHARKDCFHHYDQGSNLISRQTLNGHGESALAASSSSNEPSVDHDGRTDPNSGRSNQFQLPDGEASTEISGIQSNIGNYVKYFKTGAGRDIINLKSKRSSYNADDYKIQGCTESILFDKVLYRSRIESGGLHLCGGGLAISVFPFNSAI